MNTLGIDPGTRFTGFSVLHVNSVGKFLLKEAGCLILSEKDPLAARLVKIYEFLGKKIIESNIRIIALETPFLGKNAQNFLKLGYVRGIIYLVAHQHNVLLKEYTPKEVKKLVTGFGNAEKDQVARAVKALFPEIARANTTIRDDITDAVAISFCGALEGENKI
ncbi:MAG TPA: crossover junction endodeoxyribonuclease RuvC [Patescibacteria group bacterium]|jgi:crossover junction endodeoxyribonuclease RuvC|nr:crossover junction endodeoxyribonuclease RuvC [Patescibacteria group bacterium]